MQSSLITKSKPLNPKNLLSSLENMESMLNSFSFEELNTSEASHLKKSFQAFREDLEKKVFGEPCSVAVEVKKESGDENPKRNLNLSPNMLIAKVSHEIRTPLNGIVGFTDLLKEEGLTSKQLEKVNAIQSASYSLLEIINELLEYSKLSAGVEEFDAIDFNFHNVIKEVTYLCKTLITDKKVTLETEIDSDIPKILVGDPSKLSQILLNLLGNAIKFVEEGSIQLTIMTKRKDKDQVFLEFSIADTGIGIPESKLANIFDAFKQATENTFLKYGGSGLGLSIVKQLIENLGGNISVSSSLGIGTTFKFDIPYGLGDSKRLVQAQNPKIEKEQAQQSIKGMRVLVFEDNLLNQRLIEERLKSWGCIPFIAENAHYGLDILEKTTLDIILMDLRMPEMNGFEVTQQIRQNKNATIREIPIIALTADFSLGDKDKCRKYGIYDCILKPYNPDELMLTLLKNKKDGNMEPGKELKKHEVNTHKDSKRIDLAPILKDCMGDIDLLQELIQLYKQNALEFIGSAKTHIKYGDFEELGLAAHKIKAGLAMMQSHELHAIVVQIQEACKTEGDVKQLQSLYSCFLDKYPKTELTIERALLEIKRTGK